MATFLALCQDVVEECGIPAGGPSTVLNQDGQLKEVVKWVRDSWVDIQNWHQNWRWMRRTATIDTVADQRAYAPTAFTDEVTTNNVDRFSHWWAHRLVDPPKCYLKTTGVGGEYFLSWSAWDYYKTVYLIGQNRTISSTPATITFDESDNINLGPIPNDVYTITVDYQLSAQVLANDNDVPELPADFHRLIVYEAMRRYAGKEAAPEVLMRASTEGRRVRYSLEHRHLSQYYFGDSLA